MVKLIPDRISNDTDDISVNHQNTNYPNYAKPTIPNIIKNSANINNHNNTLCKLKSTKFKILHQNIRGLFHKTDEFLNSITLTSPHVLCLTEHHLRTEELEMINLTNYVLGGLFHKTDEFLNSITLTSPNVLCLTEHHLRTEELQMINLANYVLGAQYCRHSYKQGGVSIFVSRDIQFHPIDLNTFNKQKDLEICALKIDLHQINFIITCI